MFARKCDIYEGNMIGDRYRVMRTLGVGSYGNVYLVNDEDGNDYALKMQRMWEVPMKVQNQLMQRFEMEYKTGRINSSYLVHSISSGQHFGNPYIVMEYCKDGDLQHLSKTEQLDYVQVATDVLYGLRDLHLSGKVHRDLKPENVLRKTDGIYALSDFGITGDQNNRMTANRLSMPNQVFGTYAYIPPEQLNPSPNRENTVLPTSDIFSFGVMMYKLLTGKLPFGTLDSPAQLLQYITNGKNGLWNRQPLELNDTRKAWMSLIDGCLKPNFVNRIQSADEALHLLPKKGNVKKRPKRRTREFQTKVDKGILLRIMQGEEIGRVFYLDDLLPVGTLILTLGRDDPYTKNDIKIKEYGSNYISRRHCTFELDDNTGDWLVQDGQWDSNSQSGWHNSTNGTFVNSTEVSRNGLYIKPGDIISIGETKLRVEGY